jgi:hypothetical protein
VRLSLLLVVVVVRGSANDLVKQLLRLLVLFLGVIEAAAARMLLLSCWLQKKGT